MRLKRQLFRPGRRIEQFGAPLFFGLGTDGQGALPWLAQNLSAIFTILLSAVLIAALAAVLYAIVRELRRNTVFLDPIDVPRALAARGYSPAVVAERLLDALLAMQRRAPTLKQRPRTCCAWSIRGFWHITILLRKPESSRRNSPARWRRWSTCCGTLPRPSGPGRSTCKASA